MLSDYELFIQLCKKRGVLPPLEISEALKIGSSTGALRLLSQSIALPICVVIGRVLASSSTITSVDLSDCMLIPEGLTKILEALYDGSSITSLNLKGNNISGAIVSQLGDIFYHNNTLKHLNIEWNALGTHIESFEKFCNGLCVNHNVEELDLRYNQINQYCAEALSNVLRTNKSLKMINLAWNALGSRGGQIILNGLKENTTLIQLDLRGNRIATEIIDAVDNCTCTNQRKRMISQANISKAIKAAKTNGVVEEEYRVIKKRSKKELRIAGRKSDMIDVQQCQGVHENSGEESDESVLSLPVMKDVPKENESGKVAVASSTNITVEQENSKETELNIKITEVNKILQDRTTAINILTNELLMKNGEIETAKSESDQLRTKINQLQEERENLLAQHVREISDLKHMHKSREDNWNKMYRELEEVHKTVVEKNEIWEAKARRYERDIHKSSLEIISLREKLMVKSQSFEDMVVKSKTELHRGKRELQEKESRHKIELNVLKNTLKETTQALEECQTQLQKSRIELRDTSVHLSNVKSRLSEMEQINAKYTRVDDCLQKMKDEKSIIEEKFADSQRTIASLKRQITTIEEELVEPQRKYNLLKDDLENEREKTARLKRELGEERARMKEQDIQIQLMNSQITTLNTQIDNIQKTHAEEIRDKDKEKKQLKEIIANKERELNDSKAEEAQRASHLYAAFSKYISSIGPNVAL